MTLISELIYGIIYIFSSLCYSVWHMVIIPVAFLGNDGLSCPSAQKEELDWLGLFLFDRWHHWQTENIQGKCQRPNWKHGANTVHLRWMITKGDGWSYCFSNMTKQKKMCFKQCLRNVQLYSKLVDGHLDTDLMTVTKITRLARSAL